jgi:hypothetical protein
MMIISIPPGMGVESHTPVAVRKDLPNRNTGRDTLVPDHFPSESGLSPETPRARRFLRAATIACVAQSTDEQHLYYCIAI